MNLYRFSPIKTEEALQDAIKHIHVLAYVSTKKMTDLVKITKSEA